MDCGMGWMPAARSIEMAVELPNICPKPDCREIIAGGVEFCPNCGTKMLPHSLRKISSPRSRTRIDRQNHIHLAHPDYLEIDTGSGRRWWGKIAYVLFFITVAGLLLALFIRFTNSIGWAVALVAFMLGYMLIMGRLAGKNLERHD